MVIVYLFAAWSLSGRVLFPESSLEKTKSRIIQYWGTTYEASMSAMPAFEEFSTTTFDGLTLKGKYFTTSDSSSCVIIFAHGWGAMWADMLKYVPAFSNCNCDYIFYDHRAHNESEGIYGTGGIHEARDLWTITEWVQQNRGMELSNIGWIGSSWGAAAALIAGADKRNAGFIIADSPFRDWNSAVFERAVRDYGKGINLLAPAVMRVAGLRAGVRHKEASSFLKAKEIDEPVMLIHSKNDTRTNSSQSEDIAENLNSRSVFYHTDWGNDHVMDVVKNTAEFTAFINEFLSKEAPQFLKPPTE